MVGQAFLPVCVLRGLCKTKRSVLLLRQTGMSVPLLRLLRCLFGQEIACLMNSLVSVRYIENYRACNKEDD